MSLDLDEVEELKLWDEIQRRSELREKGLCDYCGRPSTTTPCKFPQRHAYKRTSNEQRIY